MRSGNVDCSNMPNQDSNSLQSFAHVCIKKSISQVLIVVLLIAAFPIAGKAAWRDQSDSLPGMMSGKQVAIAVAGTVGAIVAVMFIFHKGFAKPHAPFTLTPKKPDWGMVKIGDQKMQEIVILNDGKNQISFVSASISGEAFSMGTTPAAGSSLKPGETIHLQVSAKPVHTGNQKGMLTLVFKDGKGKDRVKKTQIQVRAKS
jgi:hypothetical protein